MRRISGALSIALTFTTLGCECSDVTLGRDDAGRRDAGAFTPRTDECGNGIDDDRNGRIDDGCACGQGETQSCFSGEHPGHGVGACRDGLQTCAVQEFGDWGAFSCVGETLPSAELCDGIDNDCDGARDEDCPCEFGAVRACGAEFVIDPCRPGVQTCRAGVWSRCEGAIGPTADVCDDAIDNDCDGSTNEGCECVSMPERCSDRIDNDCDGEVDEVTCAPFADAGVSDAGVDAATPLPSCGAPVGPQCLARVGTLHDLGALGPSGEPARLASRGDGLTLVGAGFFARADADGALVDRRPFFLRSSASDEHVELFDTGSEYILSWLPDGEPTALQRLSYTGDLLGEPVRVPAELPTGFDVDSRSVVTYAEGTVTVVYVGVSSGLTSQPYLQRFDATLRAMSAPVPLDLSSVAADSILSAPLSIASIDGSHFVASFGRNYFDPVLGTRRQWPEPYIAAVNENAVVGFLSPTQREGARATFINTVLGASCDRALAWWSPPILLDDASAPRRAVLDGNGRLVAPPSEPIGEHSGGRRDATVIGLGTNGFVVVEHSEGAAGEAFGVGEEALLLRFALDGTLLQRLSIPAEGWGTTGGLTGIAVGECVFVARTAAVPMLGSSDHVVVAKYCPAPC